MNLDDMKEIAVMNMDVDLSDHGYAEGEVDGDLMLVVAKRIGVNKPGRKPYVKFSVINKSQNARDEAAKGLSLAGFGQ